MTDKINSKADQDSSDVRCSSVAPGYLLNCPFCGKSATLEEIPAHTHGLNFMPDHLGSFTIECASCCCGIIGEDKARLIEHWNKRDNPWCEHCKEEDCMCSLDGTCEMIRKYLSGR